MRTRVLFLLASLFVTSTATLAFGQTPPPPPPPPRAVAPGSLPVPPLPPTPPEAPSAPSPTQGARGAALAPRPMPARATDPQRPESTANIRIELEITDTYTGAPAEKTVTLVVGSGGSGRVRTQNVLNGHVVQLNVDAIAYELTGDKIRVQITFEYTPSQATGSESVSRPAALNESFTVFLNNGRPLVVTQSADPASDRKVMVEVTATILK